MLVNRTIGPLNYKENKASSDVKRGIDPTRFCCSEIRGTNFQ